MILKLVRRHWILENIIVMDENGKMNDKAGKYEGMDRFDCRKQ